MNRHALGLRFPILIAAGCIAMDDAQAADTNEKETVNAITLEALDDHLTRLESTIAGNVYTALFDPCLESAAINMEFNRAPDGSGNVFILKDAGRWGTTHRVEAVNDVCSSMVYGQSGEAFLTDRK